MVAHGWVGMVGVAIGKCQVSPGGRVGSGGRKACQLGAGCSTVVRNWYATVLSVLGANLGMLGKNQPPMSKL